MGNESPLCYLFILIVHLFSNNLLLQLSLSSGPLNSTQGAMHQSLAATCNGSLPFNEEMVAAEEDPPPPRLLVLLLRRLLTEEGSAGCEDTYIHPERRK